MVESPALYGVTLTKTGNGNEDNQDYKGKGNFV